MAASIKQRDLNLLLALDRKTGKTSKGHGIALFLLAALVLILILVGFAAFYLLQLATLKDEKADIQNYLNDPAVAAQLAETETARQQADDMKAQSDALAGAMDNITTYPKLSDTQIEDILAMAGDAIDLNSLSFDRMTGILNLSGTTSAATKVSIFVTQIRVSGIFEDVTYSGYSGSDVTEYGEPTYDEETGDEIQHYTTSRVYSFNVTALVLSSVTSGTFTAADDDNEEGGEE